MSIKKRLKTSFFIDSGLPLQSTSYKQDFISKEFSSNQGKKRLEHIAIGGRLHGRSNYQENFSSKEHLRTEPSRPVIQK